MSLRSRLALIFGLLALAVSAVVGGFAYRATQSEVENSTDEFLEQRAQEVADGIRVSPEGGRSKGSDSNGVGGLPFDPDAIVQSTNSQGDVTGTSGGDLPITPFVEQMINAEPRRNDKVGGYENVSVDGVAHRMYTLAMPQGGAIQVARSTAEDDAVLSGLVAQFAVIALLAAVIASVAGWWIARRTTRPLRHLADVASTVADTRDFTTQVPIERSDEIGTLAGSFRQMLTALETSREQQQRLVHDAGHELRTPLTSLRANVEMLERAERSTTQLSAEDREEILGAITAETGELSNLFDELMELATDTHDDDAPMEECDLGAVVDQVVARWQRRSEREFVVATDATIVRGNVAMLERAVNNLIGNADKFSPRTEPIGVTVDGGKVVVVDRGPGIPPEDRARVFDRFHRADATRTLPGSGLGLAIVAQIVDRHGGTAWAAESADGGAEVGFQLPVVG